MSTVATTTWPREMKRMSPPNCTNVEIVSTSLVTRETRAPRRSVFWVSVDRSWIRRNAVVRSVARPASVAVNSRTLTR